MYTNGYSIEQTMHWHVCLICFFTLHVIFSNLLFLWFVVAICLPFVVIRTFISFIPFPYSNTQNKQKIHATIMYLCTVVKTPPPLWLNNPLFASVLFVGLLRWFPSLSSKKSPGSFFYTHTFTSTSVYLKVHLALNAHRSFLPLFLTYWVARLYFTTCANTNFEAA